MNVQEFSALKIGDKIRNPWTQSTGQVVETTGKGVTVVWGGYSGAMRFFYSVVSTAWMSWSKVNDSPLSEEAVRETPHGA